MTTYSLRLLTCLGMTLLVLISTLPGYGRPAPSPPFDVPRDRPIDLPRADKTAIVIVIEENEAQTYSVTRSTFFKSIDWAFGLGLGAFDLDLPNWVERAVRSSGAVARELLEAVRGGLRQMLGETAGEAVSVVTSPPVNCYREMLQTLSADVVGPQPGKIFLDRYGEAIYANCMRDMASRFYDRVVVLTDQSATFPVFKQTLEELHQQGYLIDLVIDIHGCGTPATMNNRVCSGYGLVFADGPAGSAKLKTINGGRPLNLNAVYMVACWGSTLNQTWLDLGARASNGSRELNYYVLLSPLVFMAAWTVGGMTLSDAAKVAYDAERLMMNGKAHKVSIRLRNPITRRTESVDVRLGATWQKVINMGLARYYGEDTARPVNNTVSSERMHAGSSGARRASR